MTGFAMDFTYYPIQRNTYQINLKITQEGGSLDRKTTDMQLRGINTILIFSIKYLLLTND